MKHHRRWDAHSMDTWFAAIYQEMYTTGICFFPKSRLEYTEEMRGLIGEFVEQTGMKEEESEILNTTLLKAEVKLQKGRLHGRFKAMTI